MDQMDLNKQIGDIFSRWDHADTPGGQVAVEYRGRLICSRCFGLANLEYRVPVTEDTRFHVASVSKQVTVLSLLLLAEAGKLDIDDDIRCYLPDLVSFREPVTLRNLMNNNSGIRDQWELMTLRGIRYIDTITMDDVLETLRPQKTLNFAPGSHYLYSNSGFTLLAEVVRRVSGQSLPEFAKEQIFQPLGMEHTFIRQGFWDTVPGIAVSYTDDGTGHFVPSPLNFATWGATSMNTTARDLLRLLAHYDAPVICTPETVARMTTPPTLTDGTVSGYAGGLFCGTYKGHRYLQHSGSDAAFRAQVYSFPDDALRIALVTNTANTPLGPAALRIADLVLDLPADPCPAMPQCLPPAAGTYAFTGLEGEGFAEILPCGPTGWAMAQPHGPVPLTPAGDGSWKAGYLDQIICFTQDGLLSGLPGRMTPMQKVVPAAADGRRDLIGRYWSDDLEMPLWITEQDGRIWLRHFRYGRLPLLAIEDTPGDHYVCTLPDELTANLHFLRGKDGTAEGFRMDTSRCLDLRWIRR